MNLKAIKDRITALLTDKSSGIQPEFQKQLSDIAKRIEELLKDKHGACDIPDDLIKEIARCLVPDIIAFFETEETKREFEDWMLEQEKKLAEKTKNEAMLILASPRDFYVKLEAILI
jgi:hypothetical protein